MTPHELKKIQANNGWANGQIAEQLGVSVSTVVKWRGGQHQIPRVAEIAIRAIDQGRARA